MTGFYITSLHPCSDNRASSWLIKHDGSRDAVTAQVYESSQLNWRDEYSQTTGELLKKTVWCLFWYTAMVNWFSGHFLNWGYQKLYTINIRPYRSHKSSVSIKPGWRFWLPISWSLLSLYEDDTRIQKQTKRGDELSQINHYIRSSLKSNPDPQNGCSDTNIVSRMMELPLKLMTLLTVTISRSRITSFGPLMGRDRTRVALTLLVCWKKRRGMWGMKCRKSFHNQETKEN